MSLTHPTLLLHILSDSPDDQPELRVAVSSARGHHPRHARRSTRANAAGCHDEGDLPPIQEFRQAWAQFVRAGDQRVLLLSREQRDVKAIGLAERNGALDHPYRQGQPKLRVLRDALPVESTDRLQTAEDNLERIRNALFSMLLVAGAVGVAFEISRSTRLARPIEALSRSAPQVATCDLTLRVRATHGAELSSELDRPGRSGITQEAEALCPAMEAAVGRVCAALEPSVAQADP